MGWKFSSDRPIYLQIAERIRTDIVSGVYHPGDKLPSVRDLALQAEVNPNTMQRAMTMLEESGLVNSFRTNGRLITQDVNVLQESRSQLVYEITQDYLLQLKPFGIGPEEAAQIILSADREKE